MHRCRCRSALVTSVHVTHVLRTACRCSVRGHRIAGHSLPERRRHSGVARLARCGAQRCHRALVLPWQFRRKTRRSAASRRRRVRTGARVTRRHGRDQGPQRCAQASRAARRSAGQRTQYEFARHSGTVRTQRVRARAGCDRRVDGCVGISRTENAADGRANHARSRDDSGRE